MQLKKGKKSPSNSITIRVGVLFYQLVNMHMPTSIQIKPYWLMHFYFLNIPILTNQRNLHIFFYDYLI